MTTETNDASNLKTLNASGKPPESRIGSAFSAYSILDRLIKADNQRSNLRGKVQGLIDGNQPYLAEDLKRYGQGHRSNFNTREAEAIRDSRKASYYELMMGVANYADIFVESGTPEEQKYGPIISAGFHDLLNSWNGFLLNMLLHQDQMITWGIGHCFFPDPIDFRFEAVRIGSFLVPERTKASIDKIPLAVVRSSMEVYELFSYVKDEETEKFAQESGWNTAMIKKILARQATSTSKDTHQTGEWESLQAELKSNQFSMSYSKDDNSIKVSRIFCVEYDGSVSMFIISEMLEDNEVKQGESDTDRFLYRKISKFKSLDQTVQLFFAGIGEGTYHSIKGLGAKVYALCVTNNRLINTLVDSAMLASTVLVQGGANAATAEQSGVIRIGPLSRLPDGYTVVDAKFRPDLDAASGVSGIISGILNRNIGRNRPDIMDTDKVSEQTVMNAKMRAYDEARLETADVHLYYMYLDGLYKEVLRRVLSEEYTKFDGGYDLVMKFRKYCKDQGVPSKFMNPDMLKIKANRAIGYGSPVMRSIITAEILGISGQLKERGKENALNDYILTRVGPEKLSRYVDEVDTNLIQSTAHVIAGLESNDHAEGVQTDVGVDDPHVIHLIVHFGKVMPRIQEFGQTKDMNIAISLQTYLAAELPHMAQHIDNLKGDTARTTEYKTALDKFTQLAGFFQELSKQVSEFQKQKLAEQQQRIDEIQSTAESTENVELRAKLAKIAADTKVALIHEQNQQALREMKTNHGMMLKERMISEKLRLMNEEANQKGANQ